MDVSRELSSLKRRAARLAVERTVPDLEMPVYFEGEEAPEVKVWELPDGKKIPLSLPVMIEKKTAFIGKIGLYIVFSPFIRQQLQHVGQLHLFRDKFVRF